MLFACWSHAAVSRGLMSSSSHGGGWLPSLSDVLALDATSSLLALARLPSRLQLYAAGSWRCLLDVPLGREGCRPHMVQLSDEGTTLVWADTQGGIRLFSLSGAPLEIHQVLSATAPSPATAVALHHEGSTRCLLGGDEHGELRLWRTQPRGGEATACSVLLQEASPIVQLSVAGNLVLVSTHARATLLVMTAAGHTRQRGEAATGSHGAQPAEARVIGKAKRDGVYGACFIQGSMRVCADAVIAAARPGRRLWLVGGDGSVLQV